MKNYYDPQFNGTEEYHQYGKSFLFTDSIKYFANNKEAFWLLDLILSYYKIYKDLDFVVFTLDVKDGKAEFKILDDVKEIATQSIEYTDLDVSVKLFMDSNVLMFPSDY